MPKSIVMLNDTVNSYFSPKATLILADGEKPSLELFKRYFAEKINLFALDGASSWLLSNGFSPDLVIGDMDSCDVMTMKDLLCMYLPDQESSDLEKALDHCAKQGLTEISLLGGFGLRADHFLTNIAILARFADLNISMVDERQLAFICPLNQQVMLTLPTGSFISLFPLSEQVGPIWTFGVEYPLKGELLNITGRLGTLNRTNDEHVKIICENGPLLVLVPTS